MTSDQDKRKAFLARLATMSAQSKRHLLRMETVCELRFLQIHATGETKGIIDEMLAECDAKFNELANRLGY